jgi:predicted transcriptional regulator
MNMLETVKESLTGRPISELEIVAEQAGVPYHTLAKILRGETTDPRFSTVLRLHAYLSASDRPARAA